MSRSLRILVVDDDQENADSLAELFSMEGHEVEVAYSGEAAVEKYAAREFDVAFIDVVMPWRNVVESFLEIRRLRPNANVYMMTAYSVEQLLRQAIENGALGVMSKPIEPGRILRELESLTPHGIALVSEADPDAGTRLKACLESAGRRCETASNRDEALRRVSSGDVDVLIVDAGATLIDGLDVYSCLRRQKIAVPTFIVTPWSSEQAMAEPGLGVVKATGILNKPFDPAHLLDGIEALSR